MRRLPVQEADRQSVTVARHHSLLWGLIRWTTWEADWSQWRPETLPDLPDMWPGAPWRQPLSAQSLRVDTGATTSLHNLARHLPAGVSYSPRVRADVGHPGQNVRGGIPYQRVDDVPFAAVWNYTNPQWGPRAWTLPLPSRILRYQDPVPPLNGDMQSYLVTEDRYWELSAFGPSHLADGGNRREAPGVPSSGWQAAACAEWDLTQQWDQYTEFGHPVGIAGGRTPILPKTALEDEFARGRIDHAIDIAIAGLSTAAPVGWARNTDGVYPGSPIRCGHLLQLTEERFDTLSRGATRDALTLLTALVEFGAFVNDMTDPHAGHELRLCRSSQVDLGDLGLTASDFRVLTPT